MFHHLCTVNELIAVKILFMSAQEAIPYRLIDGGSQEELVIRESEVHREQTSESTSGQVELTI